MFTTIIPLYNKAPYVTKTIQSVVEQTYRNIEILIINDGSTDDSLEIIQKFDFKNIDYKIINQVNTGVSIARNNAVRLAKYNYIAFLDADDWWEPTFLEEMAVLINKYPDAGLFASSYYKVKNKIKIQAVINFENNFTDNYVDYINLYSKGIWMPIWTGATIIKKDVFNDLNGFKSNLKLGEDFDLWLRVCLKIKIAFLNKPLSNYNQDVDLLNRAIGLKFYKPDEHFLFQDYNFLKGNDDFVYLFEKLALYALYPYYIFNKNAKEVNDIINSVHWQNHSMKYFILYKILPKLIQKILFQFKLLALNIKNKL